MNPTLGDELPGPAIGGPRLDTLEAILEGLEVLDAPAAADVRLDTTAQHSTARHNSNSTTSSIFAGVRRYSKKNETVKNSRKHETALFFGVSSYFE